MQVVLFEDDQVDQLAPISWSRPAFAIGCGGASLIDLVSEWDVPVEVSTRPHLTDTWQVQDSYPAHQHPASQIRPSNTTDPTPALTVLLNGRLIPSRSSLSQIRGSALQCHCGTAWHGNTLAAAVLHQHVPSAEIHGVLRSLREQSLTPLPIDLGLLEYPHDVIRHHERCLQENLDHLVNRGDYHEVADDVFAAPGVTLGQFVVSDTTRGPIVLERESVVEPYAYLCGPAWVGAKAKIRARAQLSGAVSIGYASRVGGELQHCMMEAYSNKQHDGFLGHSYIGSWVNLGAGTCVSNLKNSYGEIAVQIDGPHGLQKVHTGMRFLGAVVADFVKTAIQTGVFSGKRIGTASNLYGVVTEDVGCFINYAKQFGDVSEAHVDAAIASQEQMMQRRGVIMQDRHRRLLQNIFEQTRSQRSGLPSRPPRFTFPHA